MEQNRLGTGGPGHGNRVKGFQLTIWKTFASLASFAVNDSFA